jgi:AbrB family looped-hinge helix DNA binding protein
MSGKRQITIPFGVVEEFGLATGDELRVETEGDHIVLRREASLAERRLRAIREVAGSMPGVWKPGDLDRLRDEWC